jgi:hypothetical protein
MRTVAMKIQQVRIKFLFSSAPAQDKAGLLLTTPLAFFTQALMLTPS